MRAPAARRAPLSRAALSSLRHHLDLLVARYDYATHLARDPLSLVRRYDDPADLEVAGLVAACLAYGRVDRVLLSAADALGRMGPRPAAFARDFDPRSRIDGKVFRGFLHRMTAGQEIALLCAATGSLLRQHGSLEAVFAAGSPPRAHTVRDGLAHLVDALHTAAPTRAGRSPRRLRFLLPSPHDGSACKRLNMWLRWMVRQQPDLDLGLWTAATPSQLIVPLDAHVIRLSRFFGLTKRRTPDWTMADEVTAVLRRLDPQDPVKYDFALSHIGMSRAFLPAV